MGEELEKYLQSRGITDAEALLALRAGPPQRPVETIGLSDRHVKFLAFGDAHIGHKDFSQGLFDLMVKHVRREKPDFAVNAGDTLEGMSGRPGHVYELSQVGFQEQISKASELMGALRIPIYGIDGNHDGWYFKKGDAGVVVGEELERRVKDYHFLGQNEGSLSLGGKTKILLFHPNDGSAYAVSYKLQKLIESFDGGDKPGIVVEGHYHKALYMFVRNVHGFEAGTLCAQTGWMRGKKLSAHMGYWLVDVFLDRRGVNRLEQCFVPFYGKR